MKKRLLRIWSAVCLAALLTVPALAAGINDPPPMNAGGALTMALMSGAIACAVALVVHYAKKFRDINRTEQNDRKKKK